MKFTPATLLAIAAGASAQISLPLPADLQAYTSSLAAAGNTDALSAVSGLFGFSDVQSVVAGAVAHSITGVDLFTAFANAGQAWLAAQPASAQPLASSVFNDIGLRAATDGLLAELQTLQPGAAAPTGGVNATGTAPAGALPTGDNSTTGANSTGAGNFSTSLVPVVITTGSMTFTSTPSGTAAPSDVTASSSLGAAAALTGATGLGAGLIAALFAAVAAL